MDLSYANELRLPHLGFVIARTVEEHNVGMPNGPHNAGMLAGDVSAMSLVVSL